MKRKLNVKNLILLIVFVVSLGFFLYSLANIVMWKLDSNNTILEIENIHEKTDVIEIIDSTKTEIIEPAVSLEPTNPYWDYIKLSLIDVDLNALIKENKDTIGWIKVEGTNINYPFVQTKDNSYYLTHSFTKKNNKGGWVFMDYRNSSIENNYNTILYGHGRSDQTMFGSLKKIIKSSWYSNPANHIVRISTKTSNTNWQVFSVYRIETTSDYIETLFTSDEQYMSFLNKLSGRSIHNFNVVLNEKDRILTLSTCYNDTDKIVLHAKLIKIEKK